ncbi:hypothetical protein N7453_006707 [Penicillium expansum]|nr:hypothetical protein N7453_006707 [Penicillium expansum]
MTALDKQESAISNPVEEKHYYDTSTSPTDDSNDDLKNEVSGAALAMTARGTAARHQWLEVAFDTGLHIGFHLPICSRCDSDG